MGNDKQSGRGRPDEGARLAAHLAAELTGQAEQLVRAALGGATTSRASRVTTPSSFSGAQPSLATLNATPIGSQVVIGTGRRATTWTILDHAVTR